MGVPASRSGLRPVGAEPATQSQAEPLVPNADYLRGPWHIVTNKFGELVLVETNTDDTIFLLDDTESAITYQPTVAIGRLIAAAPDLLAALEDMLTASQPQHTIRHVFIEEAQEKALAALRKARGEA